jgi:hypothetical protein
MIKRLFAVCGVLVLAACGGGGGDGDDTGGCAGDITACPLPDLSDEQQSAFCDTLLAAIDDPPGTVYECEETGIFLGVNTKSDCAATTYRAGCPITGGDLIDCYKAASMDACAAFAETGACGEVFAQAEACVN